MPRTRKGAGKGSTSQGVSNANKKVLATKQRARELLKEAKLNLRDVRRDVSTLKKAGMVSPRIKVREYLPSKYMLRKLAANRDIISGEVIAVKAPKKVREKYRSKGIFEERGGSLIVPRDYENQRTKISRGLVEVSRDLSLGEEVRLILPFKATDMEGVAHKLKADPTLDGMKRDDELFGFRLFGHNMNTIGFPTAEELADYILTNYAHLFSGKNGREGVKHFQLFRFKAKNSQLRDSPEEGRIYHPRPRKEYSGREKDFVIRKRLERDAIRKQKAREKESKEDRKKRLDYQRRYQAQYRQKKFLGE